MNIIPIGFGLTGNTAQDGGSEKREQEALDTYSSIVTGVVESVAAAMVGIQRKPKPAAAQGDPRMQGGAGGVRHHPGWLRADQQPCHPGRWRYRGSPGRRQRRAR